MKATLDAADRSALSSEAMAFRPVVRCVGGLVLAALAVTPIAGVELDSSYPLFAMLLSATMTALAITALLLLVHAGALRSRPTAVLGAGFAYAAATMLPYALLYDGMFPGLPATIGATRVAHAYLWFLWQAGLLSAILAYQWLRLGERSDANARSRGGSAILALTACYVVLTPLAIWLPNLPPAFEDGHWTAVFGSFMAPIIMLLAIACVVETYRSRRRANLVDVWISLVACGVVVEVYLTAIGAGRFTAGWYAARFVVLVAVGAVLAVLLAQAANIYADLIQRTVVLEGEAHTDMLTGLPNRRRFDEEFTRAFGSAIRRSSPIGVALIDIDHFKNYNDAFGHQAGDDALRRIASAIAESVERSGDFAARYGGEEFVVILEDTTLAGAAGVAERIRHAVLDEGIASPNGGLLSVSVGVAARLPGSTGEALLRQADAALYEAKRAGRNRVVSWRSSEIAPIGSAFDDAPVID